MPYIWLLVVSSIILVVSVSVLVFRRYRAKIRNIFIAGLLVIIPITLTIFILAYLFRKLDNLFSPLIYKILQLPNTPLPPAFRDFHLPGLGVVMTIVLIFAVGLFTRNVVGKRLVSWSEGMVGKIPLARTIYVAAKQIVETVTMPDARPFREVVLIEYPRKGLYTLGFLTREAAGEVQEVTDEHVVNVFVPTTPNPTSGFLFLVPKKDVIPLTMRPDDAIKMIISGGLVVPPYPYKNKEIAGKKALLKDQTDTTARGK